MIKTLLYIGMGSFTGGISRYVVSKYVQNMTSSSFPLGTFVVNITGCLIIGLLYGLFDRGNLLNSNLRLFLTVGFCGGFTTFSTFIGDNFQLIKGEDFFYFYLYLSASIICGYLLLFLGYSIIKIL
jgi:fluoride exporter